MAPSLGNRLRAGREKRGLSLQDASHLTRIPLRRLQYLEEDNFAAFGSLTYARSFLRLYSQFLSVDASDMLEKLPQGRLGGPVDYQYLVATPEPWIVQSARPRNPRMPSAISGSPVYAGMAIFFLVLAGLSVWGGHMSKSLPPDVSPDTAASSSPGTDPTPIATYLRVTGRGASPAEIGQKLTEQLKAPQDIEKLVSERTGKPRARGIE